MRLLLDEHYADAIAERLRARGFVANTVSERGLKGTPDDGLLEIAVAERRVLLSNNQSDFRPIHAAWQGSARSHWGLLLTSDRSMNRSAGNTGPYVTALTSFMEAHPGEDDLVNQVRWLRPLSTAG